MYDLGKHFYADYNSSVANPKSTIMGVKYRFTVLTERLIRFEYNPDGIFVDEPTKFVINRNFDVPVFNVNEDNNYLEIATEYFKVTYKKNKKLKGNRFNPGSNLRVDILNRDIYWSYKKAEVKNYEASSFINPSNKIDKIKSLYSIDGLVSIDDSNTELIEQNGTLKPRTTNGIDVYLFVYNKDFNLCLKDYFMLTGYPSLIPRYALGNWWNRNTSYNDTSLKDLITNFEKNEIPLSIVLLNNDWHLQSEKLKNSFTFNKDNFKAPFDMINYMHSKGIRIGLSVDPSKGFNDLDPFFEKAKQYLQPDEKGIIPYNILDPKFIDVYLKLYIHPLDALGVDFYFLETFDKNKLDELSVLKHFQYNDMNRDYRRRPMMMSYDSHLNSHKYSILCSGKTKVSWDTLKLLPLYNANASNIGVSWWSHDIGGYFKGTEDNELYTRYVQLGTFSPILRFSSDKGKYYKREPWRWSIKTLTIVGDYLRLRHKLIPYLYSEAYKYSTEGTPLIRPLYYKYPEMYDDVIYRNEYYFGSELFISPIVTSKDYVMNRVIHKFYMPDGVWYDFFTGKKVIGNKNNVLFFKDQHYPVFAKAGAIIPLGYNDNLNDTTPPKNMEIHFFPGMSNEYKLYEDDGVSGLYKKEFYLLTSIEYNYMPNNYTVIIRSLKGKSGIVPERRNYKLIFRNVKKAEEVIVYKDKAQVEYKCYNKDADFIVEINDVNSIGQLTVNCKGKNIEIDAVRLINNDIEDIISDLPIETEMKEKIDNAIFSDLPIKKRRIAVRRLANKGLDRKFIKLFLKLLEYMSEV